MNVSVVLAALIAVTFTALGAAKILAVAPMQARAAHAGLSVAAYRRIGLLDVAGALVTHLRNHDGPREVAPAVACAVVVAGYLAAFMGTAR